LAVVVYARAASNVNNDNRKEGDRERQADRLLGSIVQGKYAGTAKFGGFFILFRPARVSLLRIIACLGVCVFIGRL